MVIKLLEDMSVVLLFISPRVMFDICLMFRMEQLCFLFAVFSISFKSREASYFKGNVFTACELLRIHAIESGFSKAT